MSEVIHESEGLRIVENEKNKFTVCWLYYYADPQKRSEAWVETKRAGLSEARWAQEYLIDFTAMFGEKVFPEIAERRPQIVLQPPFPEFEGQTTFWGGLDYGQRNPSSFHVYTVYDGVTYAVWELYKPCESIPDWCSEMRACPYWDRIKYVAADPTLFDRNRTLDEGGRPTSFRDLFIKNGVYNLLRGYNDEAVWLAQMREHWKAEDPTFKILNNCPNMIREFERAIFSDYSSEKMRSGLNMKESIVDVDNHAMDDCKYFMNSAPAVVKRNIKYPDMYKMWLK